jgi:hypothetical protein
MIQCELYRMSPQQKKCSAVVPTRFQISIGGFGGPCYEVRVVNGQLGYQAKFSHPPVTISPTTEEWEQFWATVQRCDLWNWAPLYDDPDVCDGTQWEIDIQLGERSLRSFGSNSYPSDEGTGYSKPFRLLLRAVRKLIGGRSFG